MPDFYQKIEEMQGTVEDVLRKIPGFSGYFAKEDRRAADRLLREHLVREFEELLGRFGRLQKRLVDSGGIMYMERVQSVDGKMRTFIDRIDSAAEGYAGVFDAVKVREQELDRLYAFDNALLAYEEQFSAGLDALEEAIGSDEVSAVLYDLDDLSAEANNTFKRRVEALQGLQGSG